MTTTADLREGAGLLQRLTGYPEDPRTMWSILGASNPIMIRKLEHRTGEVS